MSTAPTRQPVTPTIFPVRFMDTEAGNRARERAARDSAAADNAAYAAQQRHLAEIKVARLIGRDEGHEAGFKKGWTSGMNWGCLAGSISTLAVAAAILMVVRA